MIQCMGTLDVRRPRPSLPGGVSVYASIILYLRMLPRMMVCDRYQPAHVIVSNIEWLSLIS